MQFTTSVEKSIASYTYQEDCSYSVQQAVGSFSMIFCVTDVGAKIQILQSKHILNIGEGKHITKGRERGIVGDGGGRG